MAPENGAALSDETQPSAAADADLTRVADDFRHMASVEFARESPLYERLAYAVADRPELLTPLLAAPPTQRRALLYFAAVAYLLRAEPHHPLAEWYPVLGGRRPATDSDPVAALTDFVDARRDAVERICATRTTQTNEARRAALLRPAFGRAAEIAADLATESHSGSRRGSGAIALIELGTSAGLLLATDRYAIRYRAGERTQTYGDGALTIDCDLRGDGWPLPAGTAVAVASRTGIDLAPIRPGDADGAAWLHACIWPEHTERDWRLDLALAEVAKVGPTMIVADMRDGLAAAVATVPADVLPCVFASHALVYLNAAGRAELIRMLADIGTRRDLVVVTNEAHQLHAWTDPMPNVTPDATTHITVVAWCGGAATVEVLAEGDAHGKWLRYEPRGYAFAPPALHGGRDA
ncbi:MAG TPA: DUF2332 domain-containing protein [Micromonosporaceae bacterium]|nr:DUF2332 domain-containing protein [Micromonosporaceae bacterium]